jgi:cytochrome b561
MALLLTILGFGLFIFAIRTVNRWDGGRIPIQVHVMIGIVGVVVLLMRLYLLTAPQVPKSIPSDISLRAGRATPSAIGGASERAIMNQTGHGS